MLPPEEQVASLFDRFFPVIDETLTARYRLPAEDARNVELEILDWLFRYARRPGSRISSEGLRSHVISLACRLGHRFWVESPEALLGEASLAQTLSLGPEVVAMQIEKLASGSSGDA